MSGLANGNLSNAFTGSPTWVSDPLMGWGLDFDGSNDAIVIPDSPSMAIDGDQITLVAWVKPGSGVNRTIFGKPHAATHVNPYFKYSLFQATSRYQIRVSSATTNSSIVSSPDGRFLVVGTYDGANLRIYVNGYDKGSQGKTGNVAVSTIDLHIGENVAGAERFDGIIYEVRVYDRAFSPAEVLQLWDAITRWDIYLPIQRAWAVKAPAVAVASIPNRVYAVEQAINRSGTY